jgi:hypothetical protein
VAPLEQVAHLEGHDMQEKWKGEVTPLEHVVRPEGHVAQRKHNEVSGTLGAPSAS